ncbi:MAG: hypothetical protein LRZ84_03855 [Desertifilum sp.]|nr:Npun_R2821/Npun_R2822 family protein [Oscillatoria laete-virens]MCD8485895.1 hypothetical protein [Desertifilum sp.]MDL5054047.1 hypothetical protein [Oscillatoria laete-virens NRMC-F 0139]
MSQGIYLLSNDGVYDQVIAILNSIEANCGSDLPVCIIPYDQNIQRLEKAIEHRQNVFFFENMDAMRQWETFIAEVHRLFQASSHLNVPSKRNAPLAMHRKYCAFDGAFEKFLYIDTDTLLFKPLDFLFKKLDKFDLVVHDFQRKSSLAKGTVNHFFDRLGSKEASLESFANRFHCGGFWASKRQAITESDREHFLKELRAGDIRIFRTPSKQHNYYLSEQQILNYMTLKKGLSVYNFTLDDTSEHQTGCCVTSNQFIEKDRILYDGEKRLTYLHYMGIKNARLEQLCQRASLKLTANPHLLKLSDRLFKTDVASIPYKDLFLYYRFLPQSRQTQPQTKQTDAAPATPASR